MEGAAGVHSDGSAHAPRPAVCPPVPLGVHVGPGGRPGSCHQGGRGDGRDGEECGGWWGFLVRPLGQPGFPTPRTVLHIETVELPCFSSHPLLFNALGFDKLLDQMFFEVRKEGVLVTGCSLCPRERELHAVSPGVLGDPRGERT